MNSIVELTLVLIFAALLHRCIAIKPSREQTAQMDAYRKLYESLSDDEQRSFSALSKTDRQFAITNMTSTEEAKFFIGLEPDQRLAVVSGKARVVPQEDGGGTLMALANESLDGSKEAVVSAENTVAESEGDRASPDSAKKNAVPESEDTFDSPGSEPENVEDSANLEPGSDGGKTGPEKVVDADAPEGDAESDAAKAAEAETAKTAEAKAAKTAAEADTAKAAAAADAVKAAVTATIAAIATDVEQASDTKGGSGADRMIVGIVMVVISGLIGLSV